jgi:AcrR family transcriptional regulator
VSVGADTPEHVRQRRRGQQLQAALLDVAWDELVEVGFANLSMESIAARAQTGIAVLYRRWANKDELVFAAIAHYGQAHPVETPDTGTLRGDPTIAVRSTSTISRPPSSPCRSTWFATTCS